MKTFTQRSVVSKCELGLNKSRNGFADRCRSLVIPLLCMLPALMTMPATAAEPILSASKLVEVDQFMERQVTDKKIAGGIVMISHQGKIGFFHTYGQMDLEAKKPMREDTIFRLFSMSKAITTAAALNLVDAGKLGLDDPVSKYIPSFANLKVAAPEGLRAPTSTMTVRDLMLHTAGFSYGEGPDALKEAYSRLKPFDSAKLEEMVEKLSLVPLAFDPGTSWNYSVSIDVLGRVVEVASGQSLDVFLSKAIFEPLAMPDTAFSVPADKVSRFAASYARSADGLKLIDAPATSTLAKKITLFGGGGGLVGTAKDYMRFLSMIENGGELDGQRILRPETVKLMTTNQLSEKVFPIRFGPQVRYGVGFSLGFSVRTEETQWDPAGHVGEYGWGGAASTHYWSSPADKLIVITLEQIMPFQFDTEFGVKKIIYDAITTAQPKPAPAPAARRMQPVSPEILADRGVKFSLRAPKATEVKVAGQFGKDVNLEKDEQGVWTATVAAVPPGVHEYHFVVDGLNVIDPLNSAIKPQRWPGSSILHIPATPPAPWDLQEIPHGAIHEHTYKSKALDKWRRIFVYTPPGVESLENLPVLYLAHGYSDNEATWTVHGKAQWILDSLISTKKAVPMLIVMPDSHALPPGSGRFDEYGPANSEALCQELLVDIVPLVESSYKVKAEPTGRAFAGLSMGGHHALTVALNHHDKFAWIGAFSSAPPPPKTVSKGLDNAAAVNQDLKLFWIACGKQDFLYKLNGDFNALLKEKGIHHEYVETEGNHSWPVWRTYLNDFAPKLFR